MRKLFALVLTMILSTVMFSCKEDQSGNQTPPSDSYFDFATMKECNLDVNYDVDSYQIEFDVYSEDPIENKDAMPIHKAVTDENGRLSEIMNIPTAVNKVYLYTETIGVPSLVEVNLNGNVASFDINVSTKTKAMTKAGKYPLDLKVLGGWDQAGTPDYLIQRNQIPTYLLQDLKYTLPEAKSLPLTSPAYINANAVTNVRLLKATTVTMSFLHYGGTMKNTVGYYTYPTNNPPATAADITKIVAFPNMCFVHQGGGLVSGDRIQMKYWDGSKFVNEFPAETTIAFFVNTSSFRVETGDMLNGVYHYYSDQKFNDSKMQQNIALYDHKREFLIMGFEDQPRHIASDQDFNDVMFYIETPDPKNINIIDIPPIKYKDPKEPIEINNSVVYEGTLAFEDLWPNRGDYDMNDVVLEYHCTVYRNKNNKIIKTVDKFYPKWSGGTLENGFGFQYGVNEIDAIKSIVQTCNYPTPLTRIQTNANGFELGQSLATVVLFEDMTKVTKNGNVEYVFETEFVRPVTFEELGFPPYNPFIIIADYPANDLRGKELHLPNYKPTALVNTKWLGYAKDKSNINKNIYYVSEYLLPFAINIPMRSFKFPKESQPINVAYTRFDSWARSNGVNDADWYKDTPRP